MKGYEFYTNGLDMNQFKHIAEISCYNHNYYIGNNKDLLFGKSDDDNTTEWFVIIGEYSYYLGESYTNDGDRLYRYDKRMT